jgi:hypothetical protein
VVDGTGLENRHTRKGIGGSNPSLSASSSETRQIRAKTQIALRLCYSASLLSKIQQMRVLAKMNRTVKLYCSVKRPSGDRGTKPVPDKALDFSGGQNGNGLLVNRQIQDQPCRAT